MVVFNAQAETNMSNSQLNALMVKHYCSALNSPSERERRENLRSTEGAT